MDKERFQKEYSSVKPIDPNNLMPNDQLKKIRAELDQDFDSVPPDVRKWYMGSLKAIALDRMTLPSTEGITVGNKTYAEALKNIRTQTP